MNFHYFIVRKTNEYYLLVMEGNLEEATDYLRQHHEEVIHRESIVDLPKAHNKARRKVGTNLFIRFCSYYSSLRKKSGKVGIVTQQPDSRHKRL